jgi:RNA polymerase sigma-70 factor (ECF subfamily)
MSTALELDDRALLAGLRAGDERAFAALIDRHGAAMLRLARSFCRSAAVAEEVVQETWMAVVAGVERFEERSSLATWLMRILVNRAKTRGARERRMVPLSAFEEPGEADAAVPADRFVRDGSPRAGQWARVPRPWDQPADRLLGLEAREVLRRALVSLPRQQRTVVALRDVEGFDTEEVAEMLGLTPGNVRVVLHRARARLRQALEDYVEA